MRSISDYMWEATVNKSGIYGWCWFIWNDTWGYPEGAD